MTEEENLINKAFIITRILEAPFDEAIQIYAANFDYLHEYSFIFSNAEGINFVQKIKNLNLDEMEVIHFFGSETLYCLNANSFTSIMLGGDYELKILSLVSLDTQIQSYLYRNYIDSKNQIPTNITEIQKIIDSRRYMLDCFAYMFENLLFNPSFLESQIYKDNTYAFETYFYEMNNESRAHAKEILNLDNNFLNDDFSDWYRHNTCSTI